MNPVHSSPQFALPRSGRALRGAAASILVLAAASFGTATAHGAESAPHSQPPAEAAEPTSAPCASESSELSEGGELRCQLRRHFEFAKELAALLTVDDASLPRLSAEVRSLSQLKQELERSAPSYAAPLAGDPPSTPESLLQELTRLRSDLANREQELGTIRSRLAERERSLAKAMPEIGRLLEYQRELKALRAGAQRPSACSLPVQRTASAFQAEHPKKRSAFGKHHFVR